MRQRLGVQPRLIAARAKWNLADIGLDTTEIPGLRELIVSENPIGTIPGHLQHL